MTSGAPSFARSVRTRDESQTPISGLGSGSEPAAPAPITAATENQQYNENDQ